MEGPRIEHEPSVCDTDDTVIPLGCTSPRSGRGSTEGDATAREKSYFCWAASFERLKVLAKELQVWRTTASSGPERRGLEDERLMYQPHTTLCPSIGTALYLMGALTIRQETTLLSLREPTKMGVKCDISAAYCLTYGAAALAGVCSRHLNLALTILSQGLRRVHWIGRTLWGKIVRDWQSHPLLSQMATIGATGTTRSTEVRESFKSS